MMPKPMESMSAVKKMNPNAKRLLFNRNCSAAFSPGPQKFAPF
jgi:hypothetical protein